MNERAGALAGPVRLAAIVGILLLAVSIAHGPALTADFVSFDDDKYVYANTEVLKGLTGESIAWAFRLDHPRSYYHPLTWLSLMLDATLFGTRPWGYHLVNVLLHATSAIMLLLVLVRTTGLVVPSVGSALVFAVHPLTVEVVAWVTERKAALSTALVLGAILAYTRYVEGPRRRRLALVAGLVAGAILAKPSAVVVPALLLIVDFWPLRRLGGLGGRLIGWAELRRAMAEKVPLAVVAVAAFIPSLLSLQFLINEGPPFEWPMALRIANAVVSIQAYLGALVWPAGLSVYRLFPERIAVASIVSAGVVVAAVSVLAIATARRWPFLTAGWAWFLVALVPYLGIVRSGLWPAWADRFAYLPIIGLAVAALFGLHAALRRARHGHRFAIALTAAAALPLALAARAQGAHWQSSIALFGRGAAMEPGSYVMNMGLALAFVREGRTPESLPAFEAALRIYPTSPAAHASYAAALARLGRPAESEAHFLEALRLDPGFVTAVFGYAELLASRGMRPAARELYMEFVRRAGDRAELAPLRLEALRRARE